MALMTARRVWIWLHRWTGLTLGLLLTAAALLGALMTVLRPLDEAMHPELFRAPVAAATASGAAPVGPVTQASATPLETLRQLQDREPLCPRSLNLLVDCDLETICLKCLEKEPLRRYDSAAALAHTFDRAAPSWP